MRRYADLFAHYFVQYAKVRLAYRGDFLVSVATTLLTTVFGIALVFLLFHKAPRIVGWSFEEILFRLFRVLSGRRSQIEFSTVEVDGVDEVLLIAETARRGLDPLNP